MHSRTNMRLLAATALLGWLPAGVFAGNVLSTSGYSSCLSDPEVKVTALDVSYDRTTRVLDFDVAGSSSESQNVTATLVVTAYGKQVYTNTFSPCEEGMTEMCPVPATTFSSQGSQVIPETYASQIPAIAFSIPDLDGLVQLELTNEDGTKLACIQSTVTNGKTMTLPSVSYVAAGIAAGACVVSAVSALAAGGQPGATTPSPSFTEVFGWFQGIAMNGMMSVQYPTVYQSFTTNFGFSNGLFGWSTLQNGIDNFRKATGGNLTEDSYPYLQNVTLVYTSDSNSSSSSLTRRLVNSALLYVRDGTSVSVNGTSTSVGSSTSSNSTSTTTTVSKEQHLVKDMQAYVEQLSIPQANTFMTLLLVWAIVIGSIIVLILLFKVILEAWSLARPLPKYFESWRQRYWWRIGKATISLILLLYGTWTMYCIYQFTNGDSWAAKVLAGVSLGVFTAVLAFFTWKIWSKARQARQMEGAVDKLYDDKETWMKYSLFYDNYKKGYWWVFVPAIVYMFSRGFIIAAANGHGLIQSAGQMIVEAIFLGLLLWTRPYSLKSSNWINIVIQVVRVLSVVCILVFVEELGLSQTTKTVTGIVLIIVQATLTAVLAIMIAINSLIFLVKENPHRRARKEAAKRNRDLDNLTPLDARNSLLMDPMVQRGVGDSMYKAPIVSAAPFGDKKGGYDRVRPVSPAGTEYYQGRSKVRTAYHDRDHSNDGLVAGAAEMGHNRSFSRSREPSLPHVSFGEAV